jgi:hypothetical protein
MRSEVWEWKKETKDVLLRKCQRSRCDRKEAVFNEFKRCAGYKKVLYSNP